MEFYNCKFCGARHKSEFSDRSWMVCDRCMEELDGWYAEIFSDFRVGYKARHGLDMWESEFLEGLAEYIEVKQAEYNRNLKKEREKNG